MSASAFGNGVASHARSVGKTDSWTSTTWSWISRTLEDLPKPALQPTALRARGRALRVHSLAMLARRRINPRPLVRKFGAGSECGLKTAKT